MHSFIIAEAGVNHNGSEEIALRMIEVAASAGANAIKFQSFSSEKLVSKNASTAKYQKNNTGEVSQFSMLKKLEMSQPMQHKIFAYCNKLGIEFMSTPFDEDAAEFLIGLGMKRIKISSGELTNFPFLKKLASYNLPLILSTGMSSMAEVGDAIDIIKSESKLETSSEDCEIALSLLHCTSNYPAKIKDVNLKAMQSMANEFSLPVGYSDHTKGLLIPVAAVAMGATIIEKHFTLDQNMSGPDHSASLNPEELYEMVRQVRDVEECLGDGIKVPRKSEIPIRDLVRRSVVLKVDKIAGDEIQLSDLELLRPGNGIKPEDMKKIVGKRLLDDYKAGTTLKWEFLS
jgi:N,N'-diacetyllegionaminate synthase